MALPGSWALMLVPRILRILRRVRVALRISVGVPLGIGISRQLLALAHAGVPPKSAGNAEGEGSGGENNYSENAAHNAEDSAHQLTGALGVGQVDLYLAGVIGLWHDDRVFAGASCFEVIEKPGLLSAHGHGRSPGDAQAHIFSRGISNRYGVVHSATQAVIDYPQAV